MLQIACIVVGRQIHDRDMSVRLPAFALPGSDSGQVVYTLYSCFQVNQTNRSLIQYRHIPVPRISPSVTHHSDF